MNDPLAVNNKVNLARNVSTSTFVSIPEGGEMSSSFLSPSLTGASASSNTSSITKFNLEEEQEQADLESSSFNNSKKSRDAKLQELFNNNNSVNSSIPAPIQWRGYAWRKVNTNFNASFDEVKRQMRQDADQRNAPQKRTGKHRPQASCEIPSQSGNSFIDSSTRSASSTHLNRLHLTHRSVSSSNGLNSLSSRGLLQPTLTGGSDSGNSTTRRSNKGVVVLPGSNSPNIAPSLSTSDLSFGVYNGDEKSLLLNDTDLDHHLDDDNQRDNFPNDRNSSSGSTKGNNRGWLQRARIFLTISGPSAFRSLLNFDDVSGKRNSSSSTGADLESVQELSHSTIIGGGSELLPPVASLSRTSSRSSAGTRLSDSSTNSISNFGVVKDSFLSLSPVLSSSPNSIRNSLLSLLPMFPKTKGSKNCRLLSAGGALLLLLILGILTLVFAMVTIWSMAHAADPCAVATFEAQRLADNPREEIGFVAQLPKIIHQQWKVDQIPQGKYTEWNLKWKRLFPEPEYQHMLWTDERGRNLIKDHYGWFLNVYDSYEFNIQRADAVRYFILHHYGGIYADLDYEPLVNFYDHLPQDRPAFIESPYQYNELLQNSLMSSPAQDPFWGTVFDVLVEKHKSPVLKATGPMFLDTALKRSKLPYHSLPCENFQRLPFHQHLDETSPFFSRLHREILGRLYPMKNCGDFHSPVCQFGRHHNTASYLPETGVVNLLWS